MAINTQSPVTLADAEADFRRVARMVDETGSVVIVVNDAPRYILKEFAAEQEERTLSDAELVEVSDRLIERNREAYEALAR